METNNRETILANINNPDIIGPMLIEADLQLQLWGPRHWGQWILDLRPAPGPVNRLSPKKLVEFRGLLGNEVLEIPDGLARELGLAGRPSKEKERASTPQKV